MASFCHRAKIAKNITVADNSSSLYRYPFLCASCLSTMSTSIVCVYNTNMKFDTSCIFDSIWTTTMARLLLPLNGNISVKCLFRGHNDPLLNSEIELQVDNITLLFTELQCRCSWNKCFFKDTTTRVSN